MKMTESERALSIAAARLRDAEFLTREGRDDEADEAAREAADYAMVAVAHFRLGQ
jgi:hypothetical protein